MSSQSKDWSDWLTSTLGQEMKTFDDNTSSLLESQNRAFSLHCDLLREGEASLWKRSSSTRSVRLRAREVLMNIFQVLGPEVFLLCTLAVSITKLGEIAPRTRVATLQDWWKAIQPPQGLITIASEKCGENAIEALLLSAPKCLLSESRTDSSKNSSMEKSVVLGEQHSCVSSVQDFTKTTGGMVEFLPETRQGGFTAGSKSSVHPNFITLQHAVAAFEGIVFYAAGNIPEAEVRQAWISSCLDHLRLLERLSCINGGTGSKRPRGTSQQDYSEESNSSKRLKQTTSIRTSKSSLPVNPQAENALSPSVSQSSSGLSPFEKSTSDSRKDTYLQNPTRLISDTTGDHTHEIRHARFGDETTTSENVVEVMMDTENVRTPLRNPDNDGLVKEPPGTMKLSRHTDTIPLERQIEYRFTEAQLTRVHVLCKSLPSAIQKSKQWKWERELGGATTDCLNVLSPKNRDQDISITIMVGFEEGMKLVEDLDLKKAR